MRYKETMHHIFKIILFETNLLFIPAVTVSKSYLPNTAFLL